MCGSARRGETARRRFLSTNGTQQFTMSAVGTERNAAREVNGAEAALGRAADGSRTP